MKYYSQIGQDKFVDEFLNQKTHGVFVEVGAHDGLTISNSLFFEQNRQWRGLCIEPNPNQYEKLKWNRNCIGSNVCISDFNGEAEFTIVEGSSNSLSGLTECFDKRHVIRIDKEIEKLGGERKIITVPVCTLQSLLDTYSLNDIDYCSIDTEGSELNVLKSIDFTKTNISIFTIENNYQTTIVKDYLEQKGYVLHCKLKWDDVFIKQ